MDTPITSRWGFAFWQMIEPELLQESNESQENNTIIFKELMYGIIWTDVPESIESVTM